MTVEFWIVIGAIVALLVLSAFFSGSETALTAVSSARMHHRARRGDERAAAVRRLRADREALIAAILLGNNLVNILAASLATSLLIGLFGEAGIAYATAAMTLLILVFAEVLPKTYAFNRADRVAPAVAPGIAFFCAGVRAPARAGGPVGCARHTSPFRHCGRSGRRVRGARGRAQGRHRIASRRGRGNPR